MLSILDSSMKKYLLAKKYAFLSSFILFVVFLFVGYPLLHGGFFPTFDDVQVVRIDVMTRELQSLQFPVRYINEFGNGGGYFLFTYYAPFTYYCGGVLHLVGISLVRATKLTFLLGFFVATVGSWMLLRIFADKIARLFGTLLFLTSAYLSYDVYTRGDLAEFFGVALLPLVFWGFLRLQKHHTLMNIYLAGILLALLMLTHSMLVLPTGFFLVIWLLFAFARKSFFTACLFAISIGAGLSASYWLPLLLQQPWVAYSASYFANSAYATNFLNPLQLAGLAKIPWGFLPPILGMGLFLGSVLSSICFLFKKNRESIWLFSLIGFLVSMVLVWSVSKILWDHITYLRFMQFPWRNLALATLFAVLLCTFLLSAIKNTLLKILLGLLLLVPIILQYRYYRPTGYDYVARYTADDPCSTTTWENEYLPKWTKACLPKKNTVPLVSSVGNSVVVQKQQVSQNGRSIKFSSNKKGKIVVKRYYFPAWEVLVDGKAVPTKPYGKYGLLSFLVPNGQHIIQILLKNTLFETIGNAISLCTAFCMVLAGLFFYFSKKKK